MHTFVDIKLVLRRLLALVSKELQIIWTDPKSRMLIIGLPIIQLLIFANAVTLEVKNIDVAVYDASNTLQSRELLAGLEGSPRFRNISLEPNLASLQQKVEKQDVQLGLIIPGDFATKVIKRNPVAVQVIADGRQTNSAALASGYLQQVVAQYSATHVPVQTAAVNVVTRNWYNINLDYKLYLLQNLVAIMALVITLLLTALSIVREKENGTFEQLVVSPLTPVEILLGKVLPPLGISLIMTCVMAVIVIFGFNVPFRGNFLELLLVFTISLLALSGVGLFISSVCKTQQQAILGVMTFQIPAILLSGFISPIKDMPPFVQSLTYINPLRFFLAATKDLFFKGITLENLWMNMVPLIIISFATLAIATWTFTRKLE